MRADGSVSMQDEPDVQRVGQMCILVFCFIRQPFLCPSCRSVCALKQAAKIKEKSAYDHYGGVEEVLHVYCFLCVINRADKLQQVRWIL